MLAGYLPASLADDELTALVEAAIATVGASSPRDLGQVMRAATGTAAGRADGARVAAEVRRQLAER